MVSIWFFIYLICFGWTLFGHHGEKGKAVRAKFALDMFAMVCLVRLFSSFSVFCLPGANHCGGAHEERLPGCAP